MSALSLLSMMSGAGGALPAIKLPCAGCVAELDRTTVTAPHVAPVDEPAQAVTLVLGTMVCALHARDLLSTLDRGHIAAAVADLTRAVELVADRVDKLEPGR